MSIQSIRRQIILGISSLAFITLLTGCQTLGDSEAEKREAELLETQKSLIVSLINKGSPEIAVKELRTLLKNYPDDPDFKNLMGLTHLALRNAKDAETYFAKAYKIKPNTEYALNLSAAYLDSKQPKKVIELLTKLKARPETKDYAHPERISHNIALAYELQKNTKAAEDHYHEALKINPHFFISLMRLGQIYERTGRHPKAIETFLAASKVCQVCFDPVHALSMNQKAAGRNKEALTTLKRYAAQTNIADGDRAKADHLIRAMK
jgi:tetratricopeptide (TPR) repeat protein